MSMTIERMLHDLESNADTVCTPAYIISQEILRQNIKSLYESFNKKFRKFIFGYSYKTNYAPAVLRTVHELGGYAEVVSPMELEHAINFVDAEHIIYNGVIADTDNKFLIAAKGGLVNVENLTELKAINEKAKAMGERVEVGIRVNLSIEGVAQSRFGIRITPEAHETIMAMENIKVVGVHCHITKSRDLEFWAEKAEQMAYLAQIFNAKFIDLGGNMYGPMNPELVKQFSKPIPTFDDYAGCIHDRFLKYFSDENMPTLIVEAGTPIISNAQSFITSVADIKDVDGSSKATLDGKRLDITVIGDSGKQFPYYVMSKGTEEVKDAAIHGCTCLEFDKLINSYTGLLSVGDRILFDNIGSYSNVLAPRFIQAVPAAYSYDEGKFTLVKKPDSYQTVFGDYI